MPITSQRETAGRAVKPRKDDWVKPGHLTFEQWLSSLEIERAEINRQIRREIHTRGFAHGKYCERLDRAIRFARLALSRAGEVDHG